MQSPDSRDNYEWITTLLNLYLQRVILRVHCMGQIDSVAAVAAPSWHINSGASRVCKFKVLLRTNTHKYKKGSHFPLPTFFIYIFRHFIIFLNLEMFIEGLGGNNFLPEDFLTSFFVFFAKS